MGVKRLLTLVAVALLCIAGIELTSGAAIAAHSDRSNTGRHITANDGSAPAAATSGTSHTTPDPEAAAKAYRAMQAVLPNAQVGFTVFDRHTETVLASHNADKQFAAMSVVKLLIALDVLAREDDGITVDGPARQELHQMLADSNDGIASRLWSAYGGPAIVTRTVDMLELASTQPPQNPGQWGDTLTTPDDLVTVYRYITDQLAEPHRDLMLSALAATPHTAADGFDQYFGIPDGMPNTTWAIKQGWGTSGSQAVMNSTGVVGTDARYVVVVQASASANSYSTVPAVVTAGTSALADLVGARG